jgi:hypothetical protein
MDAMRYGVVSGIRYGKPVYTTAIKGADGKRYY